MNSETYEKLLQDCSNKVQGLSDLDWQEIVDKYDLGVHYDTLRKSSQFITGGAFVGEYFKAKKDSNSYSDTLELQKREIIKERMKLQTEKIEYNKWLREQARDELIMEKICEVITTLPTLETPNKIEIEPSDKAYALLFGDEHYGVTYELKDLNGDVLNAYSPEIFEDRMNLLFSKTLELINKENIKELNVFNMGDFSDGILRVSQLMKLRYGVVEGSLLYANYLTNFLNELTNYTVVKFQMVDGNHTELRQLGQPKGTFTDDNMGKVVREFIKIRLSNNPNFEFVENPTGYIYANLANNVVLGIHGEVKNMGNALKDFSQIYNVSIDYLIAGHLHHGRSEEVGINKEVINVPSIIGVDSYSLTLRKTANAGAKLLVFDSKNGLECDYRIKLN